MGWLGKPCRKPATAKEEAEMVIERFLEGWGDKPPKMLRHKVVASTLYAKMETTLKDGSKRLWIAVVLFQWNKRELWLKYMDNTVGPNYHDCPSSWFKDIPVANDYDREWREKVLDKERRLRQAKAVKAGDVVKFNCPYGETDTWEYTGDGDLFASSVGGEVCKLRNWRNHFLCFVSRAGKEAKP